MSPEEYAQYDALALADLVREKQVAPEDILAACEKTILTLDGDINAVVSQHFDIARTHLKSVDQEAPLFGVPFGAKEEGAYYKGIPSGASCKLIPPTDPGYDASFVTRYRNAGLNLVAKLNMPELASSVSTESVVNGVCRNPWDLSRSTGGAAAAVAAGYFPAAYGNDGAGSIRIPSSCCGVFGLKPSRGRVPKGPVHNDEWGGNVADHVITRSVRDSAHILDISAGPDIGAPYSAPSADSSFLKAAQTSPEKPFKIAFTTVAPTGGTVHPDCVKAVEKTAHQLEALGHIVEEAAPSYDGGELFDRLLTHFAAYVARESRQLFLSSGLEMAEGYLEPTNFALLEHGLTLSAADFLDNIMGFVRMSRSVAPFFEDYDLLLTPTLAMPTIPHGYITPADPDLNRFWQRWMEFTPFSPLANITGQPAASVPVYWNEDDFPVGIQIMSKIGAEARIFQLASQLETVYEWSNTLQALSKRLLERAAS